MSQSSMASAASRRYDQSSSGQTSIDAEEMMQEVLNLLDDARCRAILEATSDEALSASEVSETCGIPQSTVYRKLDLLTEAGLLEERIRIRQSGKHASEYARIVEDVVILVGDDGNVELQMSRRNIETGQAPFAR